MGRKRRKKKKKVFKSGLTNITKRKVVDRRDVPINRHRQALAFFLISSGKIWQILADFLNIITLLIFSKQIILHLYFLPDRINFFFIKALTNVTKGKKTTNCKRKNETKKVF